MDNKKICVLGLGYIGLPTASLLATKGYHVLGVDVNKSVVSSINAGKVHIVEPDLDILVKSAVNSKQLTASNKPEAADIFIIAVPTPFSENDGQKIPDISFVEDALEAIAPLLKENNMLILESTSPVGTTTHIAEKLATLRPDLINVTNKNYLQIKMSKISIAYCPERVLPGKILKELIENDRIVGGINKESSKKVGDFYRSFISGNLFETNSMTGEMCKLVENASRDVSIALANELSIICDELGINVWELIELANKHPRVNILQPGPGVGGHCIAVDPWFIVATSPKSSRLIKKAREINEGMPSVVFKKIKIKADKYKNPTIGCLGLAYKNDIDDMRESPSVAIVKMLKNQNIGKILVCEPNAVKHPEFDLSSLEDVLEKSDILVLLTNHSEFYQIDNEILKEKVLIDTRGVWK